MLIDHEIIIMEKLEIDYKSTMGEWLNKLWYIHMMDIEMVWKELSKILITEKSLH